METKERKHDMHKVDRREELEEAWAIIKKHLKENEDE